MSFLKQEFKDYLHDVENNGSADAYCNALDNIEKLLNVDVDEEYSKDGCSFLYNRLQYLRKHPEEIGKNEHSVRQYASQLNKYMKFRNFKRQHGADFKNYKNPIAYDIKNNDAFKQNNSTTDIELNTILYGPPGTGKTYYTVIYSVAIIENKKLADVEKEDYSDVFMRYCSYKENGQIAFTTFHQSYGYEEFIEGIKPAVIYNEECCKNGNIQYSVISGVFKDFCERAAEKYNFDLLPDNTANENYVFIIDEINRGNISKIFGELITLIEPSKRLGEYEETEALLPYSGTFFGVPNNVYIIGTMNTADRSIAALDTALRRRFYFKEMLPNPDVLKDVYVEEISISRMLARMNKRITVLYDREHTIGHAYFMPLKASPSIKTLAKIFENNIIPLLQEYFYEDYEKIRLILGDNRKETEAQFIIARLNNYSELFGEVDIDLDEGYTYEINKKAFNNIMAYRSI